MKKISILILVSLTIISCTWNKEGQPLPESAGNSNNGGSVPTPGFPAITYTGHTKKYFDNYCTACHAPGATQSFWPLTSFTQVSVYSGTGGKVQTRVLNLGNMPPSGTASGFLTPTEKDTLQAWINQGAPQ